jgi:hypothetical protein
MKVSINLLSEAAGIVLAAVIAFAALLFTAGQKIDLENLAKGEQNISRVESNNGVPYTAYTVKDIKELIASRAETGAKYNNLLWLGNSQLHYINQYHEGDHLSPHWLRQAWKAPGSLDPLGFSLPNANLQEYLVLSRYTRIKLPVNMLIVELVFDDLREDGLRNEFADILTHDITDGICGNSASAESVIKRFMAARKTSDGESSKSVLSGTIQGPVESWLNRKLGNAWSLWADRAQIEGKILYGLYRLRNAVFGIKAISVRKMIHSRYVLNMSALADMLADFKQSGTPVLLYIAPIRQDKPIPYDAAEYVRWKSEIDMLAKQYDARLINLETLIPGEYWGSYTGDEIDFMHFRGPGHRMVADALLPHVKSLLTERAR